MLHYLDLSMHLRLLHSFSDIKGPLTFTISKWPWATVLAGFNIRLCELGHVADYSTDNTLSQPQSVVSNVEQARAAEHRDNIMHDVARLRLWKATS